MVSKRKSTVICLAMLFALFAAGCKKKAPAPPPPPPPPPPAAAAPPPPPAAPRITQFSAEPGSIQRGQSSELRWQISGETTNISIDQAIGAVQAAGNRRVFPAGSTTYTLTAAGPGGNATARATINVTEPPPPPPPPAPTTTRPPFPDRLSSEVQDAYFDYDKSDIRPDARDSLTKDAAALKSILADFPNVTVVVEGHCDERGSAEYNLGLGDRRATAARDFLVQLGIPADRLKTISYGKERPVCTEANESCWQRNRRAHFAPGQ
ncbi:MAG: peptidoglycan-associated lipoprotein Pal [Acidobacteriia bacterium]|nr:peptidoglycan-associated lipoprotein Pal [Terriglobia bacterium]